MFCEIADCETKKYMQKKIKQTYMNTLEKHLNSIMVIFSSACIIPIGTAVNRTCSSIAITVTNTFLFFFVCFALICMYRHNATIYHTKSNKGIPAGLSLFNTHKNTVLAKHNTKKKHIFKFMFFFLKKQKENSQLKKNAMCVTYKNTIFAYLLHV